MGNWLRNRKKFFKWESKHKTNKGEGKKGKRNLKKKRIEEKNGSRAFVNRERKKGWSKEKGKRPQNIKNKK